MSSNTDPIIAGDGTVSSGTGSPLPGEDRTATAEREPSPPATLEPTQLAQSEPIEAKKKVVLTEHGATANVGSLGSSRS